MPTTVQSRESSVSPTLTRGRRSRKPSEKAIENTILDVSAILEENQEKHVRRSGRKRKSTKPIDGFAYNEGSKNPEEKEGIPIENLYLENYEDVEKHKTPNKPTELVGHEDVDGSELFKFKTPKKRIVETMLTPKSTTKIINAKTPTHIRHQIKKNIQKAIIESSSESEKDFSADESDYNPSEGENGDDDNDDDESSSEEYDAQEQSTPKKKVTKSAKVSLPQTPFTKQRKFRRLLRKKEDLVLQSDNYFFNQAGGSTTSNHTLDRLKNPRLPQDQLFKLLDSMRISKEHQKSIKELHNDYRNQYLKWLFYLNEGFSVLLYGLGTKKKLLEDFHKEFLSDKPVIVVNGFFPSLTIKDILDAITKDLLGLSVTLTNLHEVVDLIEEEMNKIESHIFVIIYNIDGTMLRNEKAQSTLSRLSSVANIHLLASIDHINAGLLWDNTKLATFKFLWWDTTTMLPYKEETANENSLLVQNSGVLALSSMRNVFQSLTTNGRGIFLLIVKSQINNKGNSNYQGISFKDLYWACREVFLVSSDVALKAQLTEFIDHKLLKTKRSNDGSEYLKIPIEYNLLVQFLEENESTK